MCMSDSQRALLEGRVWSSEQWGEGTKPQKSEVVDANPAFVGICALGTGQGLLVSVQDTDTLTPSLTEGSLQHQNAASVNEDCHSHSGWVFCWGSPPPSPSRPPPLSETTSQFKSTVQREGILVMLMNLKDFLKEEQREKQKRQRELENQEQAADLERNVLLLPSPGMQTGSRQQNVWSVCSCSWVWRHWKLCWKYSVCLLQWRGNTCFDTAFDNHFVAGVQTLSFAGKGKTAVAVFSETCYSVRERVCLLKEDKRVLTEVLQVAFGY